MTPQPSSARRPRARTRVRTGLIAVVAAAGLALTGCSASSDDLADQANSGGDKGYVAGDGSVSEYAPEQRGEPVSFNATMYDGSTVSAESMPLPRRSSAPSEWSTPPPRTSTVRCCWP